MLRCFRTPPPMIVTEGSLEAKDRYRFPNFWPREKHEEMLLSTLERYPQFFRMDDHPMQTRRVVWVKYGKIWNDWVTDIEDSG